MIQKIIGLPPLQNVVETNVHYPTDIHLLLDAVHKIIALTTDYTEITDIGGWRQNVYNQRQIKKTYRVAQRMRHSNFVVLPKKGRCTLSEKGRESSEAFRIARHQHSAVESGINALEVHGQDRCPDHGLIGFKRYVALAVVARNIQKLGAELQKKALKQEQRREKEKLAA